MANDDDFILGGRKNKKSASSQGTPRTQTPRGGGNQSVIKLGTLSGGSMSFTKRLAKDMAIAKRSSGRKSYAKPSKPRTGRAVRRKQLSFKFASYRLHSFKLKRVELS